MKVNKKQPVTSGDLGQTVDKVVNSLSNFLNKIGHWLSSDEQKKLATAQIGDKFVFEFTVTVYNEESKENEDKVAHLLLKYTGGTEEYDVYDLAVKWDGSENDTAQIEKGVKVDVPEKFRIPDEEFTDELFEESAAVLFDSLNKHIEKLVDNLVGDAPHSYDPEFNCIQAAQCVRATFKKVVSSTEASVELTNVYSTYSTIDTLDAINALADDDEFVAALPEGEDVSYSITVDDDGYDVNECECCEFSLSSAIDQILRVLYNYWLMTKFVSVNSIGSRANDLSRECEYQDWEVQAQITSFSILQAQTFGKASNPIRLIQSMECVSEEVNYTYDDGIRLLHSMLLDIVSTMELYWCNFPVDFQHQMTMWIGQWKNKADYYIGRTFRGI